MKIVKLVGFFFIISVACLIINGSSVAAFKNVKEGEDAPKFNLKEVDSENSISLESYFGKNKAVLITFWATWSPRSQKELDDLNKFMKEFKDKGLEVIAVNVEKEEPTAEELAEMKKIKETLKPEYKLLLDAALETFYEYGVVAVPSTVLIDSSGAIKKIYDGYPTSAFYDIKEDVEVMLGLKEPEKAVTVAAEAGPVIAKAAKLHYGLARKLIERGMGIKAVPELENAATLDEKYDLPLVLLGEVYEAEAVRVKMKDKKDAAFTKAIDAFDRALKRNDKNLFAYSGLVRVYAQQGKLDAADEAMKNISSIDSNFLTGIVANGLLLQAKGKDDEAVKEFQRALEYNPNLPDIHYLISKSYEKQKDYEHSISSLKESFKLLLSQTQLRMSQETK